VPHFDTPKTSGPRAEALALAFLERQGLEHVESNWRCRFGEIDLVLRDGASIVFVEVRLRTRSDYGGAAESVDRRKRAKLVAAARLYLARAPDLPCRFDVVLLKRLDPPEVEWIRDAISG
jgi:putative endonuclease